VHRGGLRQKHRVPDSVPPLLGKNCFVISPMSVKDSQTRRWADALIEQIIVPALEPLGYKTGRLDDYHPA
jgi:hypothetical protein